MGVFVQLAQATAVYWISGWENLVQTIGGFIAGV